MPIVSEDRRRHDRKHAWVPVDVEGIQAPVVLRDVSRGGVLLASSKKLVLEATLALAFTSPAGGERHALRGRVVRVEPNAEDPDGLFPHLVGLTFEEEHPELDALAAALEELRERADGPVSTR